MNLLELGDVTSVLRKKNRSSRFRHFGTSSISASNDALDDIEERLDSEFGEDDRGDDV